MTMRRAVLSVYRKDGLLELARGLRRHGVTLLSSGGTAALLRENGIEVSAIAEYTGSPEILGGRVKTLHPRICGGILARPTPEHRDEAARHDIPPIDLVVVNLYPFAETAARPGATAQDVIEMIDIGGPTLIRSAGKNHERVSVLVDPADYGQLLEEMDRNGGEVTPELRRRLAVKAFAHTAAYDAAITAWFDAAGGEALPATMHVCLERAQALRYGENPHQRAALYRNPSSGVEPSLPRCQQLQGKELSYNNILDADAALGLVLELPDTAVCIVKHGNPCGAASGDELVAAFRGARATDPVSAFGGIVACNRPVTRELGMELKEMFLEAVIAPEFEAGALEVLAKKKALRLLRYPGGLRMPRGLQLRSVAGGLLVQDTDSSVEDLAGARVVTERRPTPEELRALDFAWRICKHVKSNAIVFAGPGQLVGVGAGQMSRVDSVRLAATKAQLPLAGTALGSDAFFPFRDGIDEAAKAGAAAIVQPGGSVRDEEAIVAANEHGMTMLFTGVRHFRH